MTKQTRIILNLLIAYLGIWEIGGIIILILK